MTGQRSSAPCGCYAAQRSYVKLWTCKILSFAKFLTTTTALMGRPSRSLIRNMCVVCLTRINMRRRRCHLRRHRHHLHREVDLGPPASTGLGSGPPLVLCSSSHVWVLLSGGFRCLPLHARPRGGVFVCVFVWFVACGISVSLHSYVRFAFTACFADLHIVRTLLAH